MPESVYLMAEFITEVDIVEVMTAGFITPNAHNIYCFPSCSCSCLWNFEHN